MDNPLQQHAQGIVFFAMNAPLHLPIGEAVAIASEQLHVSQQEILSLLDDGWTRGIQAEIQKSKQQGKEIGTYGVRGAIVDRGR